MQTRMFVPLLVALATACSTAPEEKTEKHTPADKRRVDSPTPTPTPDPAPDADDGAPEPEAEPTPLPEAEPVSEAQQAQAAKSVDAFAYDLYAELKATPGNMIVSPASIAFALGMTLAGAKGQTAKEMATVLHVDAAGLSPDEWHLAMGGLMGQWNGLKDRELPKYLPELKLSVANRVFGDKTTKFHRAYLDRISRDYRAPLEQLDFKGAPDPSRERINDWVEEQTYDRIQDLLGAGSVTLATRLVLVNAVYFKAQWLDFFQEGGTKPLPFWVDGKSKSNTPTMTKTGHHGYAHVEADKVKLVELPYESSDFVMDVIVPDDKAGLADIEAKLDAGHVDGWLAAMSSQRIELKLPKFEIDPPEPIRLGQTLAKLGMPTAFDHTRADFTAMAAKEEALEISEAYHKAFIAVDESGTEAAAATAVVMRAGGMPPSDEPIPVHVDRPFLFLLRDRKSGAILFMGRVTDPRGA